MLAYHSPNVFLSILGWSCKSRRSYPTPSSFLAQSVISPDNQYAVRPPWILQGGFSPNHHIFKVVSPKCLAPSNVVRLIINLRMFLHMYHAILFHSAKFKSFSGSGASVYPLNDFHTSLLKITELSPHKLPIAQGYRHSIPRSATHRDRNYEVHIDFEYLKVTSTREIYPHRIQWLLNCTLPIQISSTVVCRYSIYIISESLTLPLSTYISIGIFVLCPLYIVYALLLLISQTNGNLGHTVTLP